MTMLIAVSLAVAVLLAGVPSWVWGGLLIGAFALLCVATMALARMPARNVPRPFELPDGSDEDES